MERSSGGFLGGKLSILSTVAFFSHIKVIMLISIRRKSRKGAKEDLYALMRRFRTASAYSQDSDGTEWVGHHMFYVYPINTADPLQTVQPKIPIGSCLSKLGSSKLRMLEGGKSLRTISSQWKICRRVRAFSRLYCSLLYLSQLHASSKASKGS